VGDFVRRATWALFSSRASEKKTDEKESPGERKVCLCVDHPDLAAHADFARRGEGCRPQAHSFEEGLAADVVLNAVFTVGNVALAGLKI